MDGFVGVTDYDWYRFLSAQKGIEEVNFWKPGGQQGFAAIRPGEPFLFKLHAPYHAIVGGGFFAHYTRLPTSLVWEAFGSKNGAASLPEMRSRIEKYRRAGVTNEDYSIGCILLQQPFFFDRKDWIPAPPDWHPNIVQGRRYDLSTGIGLELWIQVQARLAGADLRARVAESAQPRYGSPIEILPRLGQGTFRLVVTDAYDRRCAITGERTLPALDAAHIRPYTSAGENRVPNGLLLRSDLHRLFDRGYLTVTPDLNVQVSRRIREEFENGRHYYALDSTHIRLPGRPEHHPDRQALDWHSTTIFLG